MNKTMSDTGEVFLATLINEARQYHKIRVKIINESNDSQDSKSRQIQDSRAELDNEINELKKTWGYHEN